MLLHFLLCFALFWGTLTALLGQSGYFPKDTLDPTSIQLLQINARQGNTYVFQQTITTDSILLILAPSLARGYYEAYYDNDSNQLALTYYNFGNNSYCQQYYKNGSMKSDSEYDRWGNLHGMHVLYDRGGEECWHADYYHGTIEKKYNLDYAEVFNYTKELIEKGKAWGCYEFTPTAMRERHDRIRLNKNGTFEYQVVKTGAISQGTWLIEKGKLALTIEHPKLWQGDQTRHYIIWANHRLRYRRLIELKPWGANWYASEYWFCKKCRCELKD